MGERCLWPSTSPAEICGQLRLFRYRAVRIKVYIETPDENGGFHSAVCWLPEYRWENIQGYTEEEMSFFRDLVRNNAHLMLEFSQDGGVLYATGA